jgi:hypothetical protein
VDGSRSTTSARERSASTVAGGHVFRGAAVRVGAASPRRVIPGVAIVEVGGLGESVAEAPLYDRVLRRQGEKNERREVDALEFDDVYHICTKDVVLTELL